MPEADKNRDCSEDRKEDGSLETTTNLPRGIQWYQTKKTKKTIVGESFTATSIGWKRSILDGRVLCGRRVSVHV